MKQPGVPNPYEAGALPPGREQPPPSPQRARKYRDGPSGEEPRRTCWLCLLSGMGFRLGVIGGGVVGMLLLRGRGGGRTRRYPRFCLWLYWFYCRPPPLTGSQPPVIVLFRSELT